MRPLVPLEARERMLTDVAAPEGVAEHAAERTQDPLDRPGRETTCEQLTSNCDNIVRCDRCDSAATELRKQVQPQLRAVEIERPLATGADRHLVLEVGKPARRYSAESEAGRQRQLAEFAERLQKGSLAARFRQRPGVDGAEPGFRCHHYADRVLAVRLFVDPALDASPAGSNALTHRSLHLRSICERCRGSSQR
jgi:hypothetical protein